jgi:hypothetical protein
MTTLPTWSVRGTRGGRKNNYSSYHGQQLFAVDQKNNVSTTILSPTISNIPARTTDLGSGGYGEQILGEIGQDKDQTQGSVARIDGVLHGDSVSDLSLVSENLITASEEFTDLNKDGQPMMANVQIIYLQCTNANTICFHLLVFVNEIDLQQIAYTLYNCGASGSFVSKRFLDTCWRIYWQIPTKPAGRLEIMTVGALEEPDVFAVYLTIQIGNFIHFRWFLV